MSKTQQKMSNGVNKNKLTNKVVLILGASGGIGSVVADLLEANGAIVCRHSRSGNYSADVSKEGQIGELINRILLRFGRIDVVVNSLSAPIKISPIFKKDWDNFLDQLNVQLKAAVDVVQAVAPRMKLKKNGHFINILSSVVKGKPPAGYADYITAKYAMWGFSECLFKELGQHGISVTCVSPDFVVTKLTSVFPLKLGEILAEKNDSKRLTQPKDIAFLVKEVICNGKFYNGKNIGISGGRALVTVD